MKGKGIGFVLGGAVGMLMSLVWFMLGGVFVAAVYQKSGTPVKKEET